MKTLIVGMGKSGRAAARYLQRQGKKVVAVDRHKDALLHDPEIAALMAKGLEFFSEEEIKELSSFDQVILSPGISEERPLCLRAKERGIEVIGEIELAARGISSRCLGITGTNGKTTVTLLTAHILNYCGIKAYAVGNVGVPLADQVGTIDADSLLVIELSSYQLETLTTPLLERAAILNITPDHLDRYPSMDSYARAKAKIASCLKEGGELIIEEKTYRAFAPLFEKMRVTTYGYQETASLFVKEGFLYDQKGKIFSLPLDYRGKIHHDIENLMACYALCRGNGVGNEAFVEAFQTFKKPPHRLEFVQEIRGVTYIDDSKGTNIDAVVRAVQTVEGKVVLIAGGLDKGFPFTSWIENFSGKVKCICAIGESAPKLERELSSAFLVKRFSGLEEAVRFASNIAERGETVLLSPGCSSFDMFKDYAHRGQVFKEAVKELEKS